MAYANVNTRTTNLIRETIERATFDPDWFCDEFLNCPNDPWQSEMMNAVADLDRIAAGKRTLFNHDGLNRFSVVAFHGPGKTHWLAKLMHWFNFTRRGRIPCTAPKEKQLITRLWPEFRKIYRMADEAYQSLIEPKRTTIEWCNDEDWCAMVESAAAPENLQGLHDDWLLYLVDEASGVEDPMFHALEGALSTPSAVLVLIGNPTRTSGEFYNSHNKPGTSELYYRKKIQHHETPRISQKWVDDMIRKYGEDSPVVQVRVFGNFVDMQDNQLIALEWLARAVGREFVPDGSIPRLRVTVDVADGGLDKSVVSVGLEFQSFRLLKKQHLFSFPAAEAPIDTADAAQRIYDAELEELRAEYGDVVSGDLVVDSVGVGAGTAGTLIKRGCPVIAYKGGAGSDDPKQWANRRTQSYCAYRNEYRDDQIVIADDYCAPDEWDDFYAQHTSILKEEGDKLESIEPKKKLLARGVKSPDMSDAGSMHCATAVPTLASAQSAFETIVTVESEVAHAGW